MEKKTEKIVFGVATGILTALIIKSIYSLKTSVQALQIKVLSLNIKGIDKIYLSLQIFNPTNQSLTLDSISGEVYFNNTMIGVIQYFNTVPIAPLAYSKFENILVELSPQGVFQLTKNILIRNKETGGNFLIKGNVYSKGIAFPFMQSYKVW